MYSCINHSPNIAMGYMGRYVTVRSVVVSGPLLLHGVSVLPSK